MSVTMIHTRTNVGAIVGAWMTHLELDWSHDNGPGFVVGNDEHLTVGEAAERYVPGGWHAAWNDRVMPPVARPVTVVLSPVPAPAPVPVAPPTGPPCWDRDDAIKAIRTALRKRSGKSWSVTGGRGTGWGWITISAPPARRGEYGSMTEQDQAELAALLGLDRVHHQGQDVPASDAYRAEYVARAEGRTPDRYGTRYWD